MASTFAAAERLPEGTPYDGDAMQPAIIGNESLQSFRDFTSAEQRHACSG
ncbi:hypothetical protein [Rhizobium terrae]|nr:hypothetical protein [Rhizobium terrae]